MSSKVKENGKNRSRQFRRACKKANQRSLAYFYQAAAEANNAHKDDPKWKVITPSQILDAHGRFEMAEANDQFEVPSFVSEKIDRDLDLQRDTKKVSPAKKGRHIRHSRVRTSGGVSLTA